MELNWDMATAYGFVLCMTAGIYLIKKNSPWKWSLRRRALMRNVKLESFFRYQRWESVWENRKKGRTVETISHWFAGYREKKMDKEIFESITFLRNLASLDKGRNSSADSVIEKLSEHNGLLQPVYIKMLNLLRVNKPKEAAALFSKKVGTTAGRDFAGLLIQWDRLEPGELLETLLSYEKSMKAARLTEQKRRDEIVSDLIYFPVVVNILVIFVNFIYVAYFLDQREMLQMFV